MKTREEIFEELKAIEDKLFDLSSDCSCLGMSWSVVERLQTLSFKVNQAAIACLTADILIEENDNA